MAVTMNYKIWLGDQLSAIGFQEKARGASIRIALGETQGQARDAATPTGVE
jgi:hypothetical protein